MNSFSSMEFIMAGGAISMMVALILLLMSVLSWYFMIARAYQIYISHRRISHYLHQFWDTENLQQAVAIEDSSGLSTITKRGIAASQHYQQLDDKKNHAICNQDEFVAREINREISAKSESLQQGLSVLASIGSIAPFVGLFGTVWGIYHALLSIGQTGQATLDKVAGPVGEALIMTAIGLAVAIPAVLAYNAILHANQSIMRKVEKFSETLHTLLTTGAVIASLSVKNDGDRLNLNGVKP